MSVGNHPPVQRAHFARTVRDMRRVARHPAFRLGFLDALSGARLDHDLILQRIENETERGALARGGWFRNGRFNGGAGFTYEALELAQYRYEEGRLAVMQYGIGCGSWNDPSRLPPQLSDLIERLVAERSRPR